MTAYVSATRTFTDGYLLAAADLTSMRSDLLADAAPPAASQTVRGTVKIGTGLAVDGNGLLTATAGTGTAAPTAPTVISASSIIGSGGTYKIVTAGITVTLAPPTAGTFPVYSFTLDRLASTATATVAGPSANSIYVGTAGTAATSVVLQGGDTWEIQWDGTYFCTLLQPLSQQLSSTAPTGAGITAATVFYTNDAGTDVIYTAAQIAAYLRGPTNSYTSGAIAPTDGVSYLKATAAASYTLGNSAVDGWVIEIKRTNTTAGADQTIVANLGGVSGATLVLKTLARGSLTIGEAVRFRFSMADSTWYIF